MVDYYQILDIPENATQEEIRKAYRERSKKWHPDKHVGSQIYDLAVAKQKELNQAYEVLSNPEKRRQYDQGRIRTEQDPYTRAEEEFLLGTNLYESGNLSEAYNALLRAVALAPNFWEAYSLLGQIDIEQGNYIQASKTADKIIHMQPNVPDGYILKVRVLSEGTYGSIEATIKLSNKVIQMAPDVIWGYLGKAQSYIRKGQLERARIVLEKDTPEHLREYPEILELIREICLENDDYDSAWEYHLRYVQVLRLAGRDEDKLAADTLDFKARIELHRTAHVTRDGVKESEPIRTIRSGEPCPYCGGVIYPFRAIPNGQCKSCGKWVKFQDEQEHKYTPSSPATQSADTESEFTGDDLLKMVVGILILVAVVALKIASLYNIDIGTTTDNTDIDTTTNIDTLNTPKYKSKPTNRITGKDGAPMSIMALIPAGEFSMGSDYMGLGYIHSVYIDAFYMDIYEVTNAQYGKFMDATGHSAPDYWYDSDLNAPDQPVVGVSWYDAVAYAEWAGKRLPTEAEWERAARGGLVGKRYPWGDEAPDADGVYKANYTNPWNGATDGYRYTAPVGRFPPNGYGLYDMAGNAWEWCADWYDPKYYADSPYKNPLGPDSGSYRTIRGGSWCNAAYALRVANRSIGDPSHTYYGIGFGCGIGFRCVQDAGE